MGQYYHAVILDKDKQTPVKMWHAHDFMDGLKLVETCYIGNPTVGALEEFIYNNPQPVLWIGDYADKQLYDKSNAVRQAPTENDLDSLEGTYVINHDKKQFYVRPEQRRDKEGNRLITINPLSLLTCEGNDKGSGDYYSKDEDKMNNIGIWARDTISLSFTYPGDDYTEVNFDFYDKQLFGF